LDVNLPDGRILRNVPDGTTQSEIISRLRAAGEDVSWAEPKQDTGPQKLAKETGLGESILVGAGKKTNDILNGITQLYLKAKGEDKALGGLAQNVQAENDAYAPLRQQRPYSTGFGEALPAMAVPGAGASYGGAAMAGALPELLSYGDTLDRAKRGGVGAAGGMAGRAIGSLLATVLKPAGAGVNADKAAMQAAERIGFKPLAGQATQNPALMNVENFLARSQGSSGTMQGIAQSQREAINRAAANSIGQQGNEVSASLLDAGTKTIGREFDRLQSVTAPKLGNDFMSSLVDIETANAARGSFRSPQIDKLLNKSLDLAAQGNLSGQAYKEIRTQLSGEAQSAFRSGDATLGQALKTVRGALDDAAEQSLSKADQEAWKAARNQWGNLKVLLKGNVAEAGDVSAARVAQQLRAQGPSFRTGNLNGPLADVARIGEGFKGPLNPNSGTLMASGPLSWATAPINFAAVQVYTLPVIQKWMREGIVDIGKNGELVIKVTGVPLGTAGTKEYLGAR
jgi:hypothetical protein